VLAKCLDCGKDIEVNDRGKRRKRCPPCQFEHHKQNVRDHQKRQTAARKEAGAVSSRGAKRTIQVCSCPDDFFPPGRLFSLTDINSYHLFSAGARVYDCWIPGMVFEDLLSGLRLKVTDKFQLSDS
jgi:hypothetical protein